jgi:hypothetical protein
MGSPPIFRAKCVDVPIGDKHMVVLRGRTATTGCFYAACAAGASDEDDSIVAAYCGNAVVELAENRAVLAQPSTVLTHGSSISIVSLMGTL